MLFVRFASPTNVRIPWIHSASHLRAYNLQLLQVSGQDSKIEVGIGNQPLVAILAIM